MTLRNLTIVLALVALGIAAFAVGQNLNYRQDPSWKPPEKDAARVNPLRDRQGVAEGGKKMFARRCTECHGQDGKGIGKAANLTLDAVQQQSDGKLFWKITNGNQRHGMPSFANLPEPQRWQLVLAIRQLAAK